MPPFSQKPRATPPTPSLIVRVPICEWCKKSVGRACPSCTRITCYRCLFSNDGGRCVHVAKTDTPNDGWGEECPNPHCDIDCNLCSGSGMIHTALQRRLGRGTPEP